MSLRIDSAQSPNIREPLSAITEKSSFDFQKTFSQVQLSKTREIEDFLQHLNNLGNQLAKSLSLKDLSDFRDSVKLFLKSTFGKSSNLQEESFWDFHGRPKILAKINKINQALEDLGKQFIDNHPKPLDILAKIDQIRGLILDLFA